QSTLVQISANTATALALVQVRLAAVFAGEEATGEARIGDDADVLGDRQIQHRPVEAAPIIEVVARLEDLISGEIIGAGGLQCLLHLVSSEVGCADGPYLSSP